MALRTNNRAMQGIAPNVIRQFLLWAPIVVGLVHQFLMLFFEIDSIYVFVDPPGSITPFASLEWQWWIVLLMGTATICIAAYSARLEKVPNRIVVPTYFYILFLLFLIKPV